MSDYDDEAAEETRQRTSPEGVRIIGAEEAAAALEAGQAAGRRPDDAPRFGDVPERPQGPSPEYRFPLPESMDPTTAVPRRPIAPVGEPPEMPHWTEPPTGEVPKVLAGDDAGDEDDLGAWSGLSNRSPRWRDRGSDWEEDDFAELAALGDDDTRMGALDVNRTEHSDLFSFDDPEPVAVADPEPAYAPVYDEVDDEPVAAPPRPQQPTRIRSRAPQPPADYGARPGGRDMGQAVGVGVAIAAVALIVFSMGASASLVLATVVVTFACMEAYAVLRRAGYQPATLLGLCATVSLMLATYSKGPAAFPLVIALTTIFAFLWYLAEVVRARPTINVAVTLFAFLWVAGLGSFSALMLAYPADRGVAFLLAGVICTVAYDVGGLFFGSQMGTRPLMPEISPNKTWEGLIGGMAAAVIAGVFTGFVLHPWTPGKGFVLGVVVAVVAPLGDLCESMVKRDIGIKDMGSVLPGHGGVLDRVDALLFVLPAVYYLVQVLKIA